MSASSQGVSSPGITIPASIVAVLRCPVCADTVRQEAGEVTCTGGHRWPQRDGYLDASPGAVDEATERTFESFGYEWTHFDETRAEDEQFWQEYVVDVPLEELRGRIGLDAGCGKGRYTRFTARHLEAMVALDGSDAIRVAARDLASLGNVLAVRSDLRRPPLAAESFGFISCLGVLHHLSDPEEGFRSLLRLLAPDGLLLIYLYSRPTKVGMRSVALQAAATLRRVTTRMPVGALRLLSAPIAGLLYAAFVVPGSVGSKFGVKGLSQLPLGPYRGKPLRSLWLDTFDRLSAPLEKRYTWAEVEPWFTRAGLTVVGVSEGAGLTVVARRPVAPQETGR